MQRDCRTGGGLCLLYSTPDEDPEMIYEDEEECSYAPRTERNNYVSEADQAAQANDLLSAGGAETGRMDEIDLQTEVSNSFLQYALSIILGRAIPDARDGLKPVHRRILYAMDQLNLSPSGAHRKCARVVGEVLGKFHPHGDMAVYDALVRMAQTFATHYPLLDGHGNFGSIDADPAAAMRYTECRLSRLSTESLLQDLKPAVVDFVTNFDGNELEPTVLPARLPVLLLNGGSGIAVGMATNIPPHNLKEIMTACAALVEARVKSGTKTKTTTTKNKKKAKAAHAVSDEELFAMVPGPDFPTGACMVGTAGAQQLYATGQGGIVLRAVTHMEQVRVGKSKKTTRTAIVVTELPYSVNKAALLEKLAKSVNDKRVEGIADLRDESDRDGIRVVIECKSTAVPAVVLNNLLQKTQLQTTFSGNLLALFTKKPTDEKKSAPALDDNNEDGSGSRSSDASSGSNTALVPSRFTLRQALDHFLDFRFSTLRRKARHELEKVEARAHVVAGLLIAVSNMDDVVDILRKASDTANARDALQNQLGLDETQTSAILKLALGQLVRTNQEKLLQEEADLKRSKQDLGTLLERDSAVYKVMLKEFEELTKKFGTDRKTKIVSATDAAAATSTATTATAAATTTGDDQTTGATTATIPAGGFSDLDLIPNTRSVIVVTRGGYIKRMPLRTFESQGRGTRGKRGSVNNNDDPSSSFNDDDEIAHCFTCNNHDTLLMVTVRGIAHGIRAYEIPKASRTARGQPIPTVLGSMRANDNTIAAILPISQFSPDEFLVCATARGWIKRTPLDAFERLTGRGLTIATLDDAANDDSGEPDRLCWCHKCKDGDDILIGTAKGMATRFQAADIRPTGRTSRGVKAMKLRPGDAIADMNVLAGRNGDSVDDEHREEEFALAVTSNGFGKRLSTEEFKTQKRGGVGVIAIRFKNGNKNKTKKKTEHHDDDEQDQMNCLRIVRERDEILVITAKGIMVRQQVSEIPSQSRTATGVLVQKVDPGDRISAVSLVPRSLSKSSSPSGTK